MNNFLNLTLTNCTISGNHADAGSGDKGGGVWSARGNLVLNNCTITGNTAAGAKSAGGVRSSAVDAHFMLRAMPGVFVAGEMLDFDAPTGGYLLQAAFATGHAAARGVLAFLNRPA